MIRSSSGGTSGLIPETGGGIAIQDRVEDHGRRVALECLLARRHLVQDDAEREQVASLVEILAARLLRATCTRRCPPQGPPVVSMLSATVCAIALPSRGSPGVSLASPKSSTLACAREVTKMLAGLMSRCRMPSECAVSSASAI